ncbi:MAG: hypothetical protein GXP31_10450 [Kiritimatiellaeota bacterium]|nr:hypothetical protein [Kiritimatiellota bacterium]
MKTLSACLAIGAMLLAGASAKAADAAQAILEGMTAELRSSQHGPDAAAECRVTRVQITAHRAHGPNPLDYRRELSLRNPQVVYVLRYWMNVTDAEGKDPVSIEGSSGLGMTAPNAANWYINNFFELRLDGKEILKQQLARFEVLEPRGDRARARLRWRCPEAVVTLDISLGATDDFLTLRCTVEGLNKPAALDLGFRAYPGHYPPPRARRAATHRRELRPTADYRLEADETAVVLWDEAEPRSPCAAEFANAGAASAHLNLQTYGVTLWLRFSPTAVCRTGPIHIWDVNDGSLNDLMQNVFTLSDRNRSD